MDKGWRKAILTVFGLGTTGAVLLASGVLSQPPQAAPAGALPPAVAPQSGDQGPATTSAQAPSAPQSPGDRIAALSQELQGNPESVVAWAEMGSLYFQMRRYPAAADAYGAALELEPANGDYRTGYASALFFLGMTRAALKEYRKVVQQEPENANARMNLAVALSHSTPSDIPAAVAEWEEVVRLAPGEPIAAKAQEYLASYRKP